MSRLRLMRNAFDLGIADARVFWSSWRVWLLTWILRVVTSAATWVLLGRLIGSEAVLHFLLIGQGVIVGTQSAGFAVPASAWDRMSGTYPLLVIAPPSLVPLIMGRSAVWMANGIASSLFTFAILLPLFRVPAAPAGLALLPLFVLVICASSYCLFLFLGCFIVRAPQLRNLVHSCATLLISAICGVAVPTAFWPGWVQLAARALPVTHGLAALRSTLERGPTAGAAQGLLLECVVGACWLALACLTMDRMADAGRRDGSIEFA
jgi:ABC-2 type transport system permease protein